MEERGHLKLVPDLISLADVWLEGMAAGAAADLGADADACARCEEGHALCAAAAQLLLPPLRAHGLTWLRAARRPALRVLLHCARAQPALAAAAATDAPLIAELCACLLYKSPSPRDRTRWRMPSSA